MRGGKGRWAFFFPSLNAASALLLSVALFCDVMDGCPSLAPPASLSVDQQLQPDPYFTKLWSEGEQSSPGICCFSPSRNDGGSALLAISVLIGVAVHRWLSILLSLHPTQMETLQSQPTAYERPKRG